MSRAHSQGFVGLKPKMYLPGVCRAETKNVLHRPWVNWEESGQGVMRSAIKGQLRTSLYNHCLKEEYFHIQPTTFVA